MAQDLLTREVETGHMQNESFQALVKPPALIRGSRIGLIAPSSPFSEEFLKRGIRFLEGQGFQVCHLPGMFARRQGFLAGGDEQRAEELMTMFADPMVDAVFVVRGGYGAQRILDRLDPEKIARNPKIFLGYSDVTTLLSFLVDSCGLVCFHGPLATEMGSLPPQTERFLLRALTETEPLGALPITEARWIRTGEAIGQLVGGNLSILCSTLGTPWEVRTEGRILFLEDSGEKPYRIDRMLVQMKQAGKFSRVAGLVFGDVVTTRGSAMHAGEREAVFQVISENTRDLGVPVLCGLAAGHGMENLTLPIGVRAGIGCGDGEFSLLEPALVSREQAT
jgi:muramoyltetrapeptide carboxypeptidase